MSLPPPAARPRRAPLALRVAAHEDLGGGLRWLTLAAPDVAAAAEPGQFAHVRCGGGLGPDGALGTRRAYSLADADPDRGTVSLLYRVWGRGSVWLSQRRPGEVLDVLAPLGTPFRLDPHRTPVFVAGGTGVAPFIFLARRARQKGLRPLAFVGARTAAELAGGEFLAAAGAEVAVATDDGTAGFAGTVVDLVVRALEETAAAGGLAGPSPALYACGPHAMMAALAAACAAHGWPLQVSLETPMACGIGICLSCTVPGPRGPGFYRRCCVEGPVFDAREVAWE
ncbi:MAG: dihydroorotate dehydrogenase electron transfer subunit [Firmicutes bacterium]|nr:dihydroorotate dehydrogenase electron transfer subunit [Bacillota bacterium]